jgi:two-component system sensor histidine kinase UhpB
MVMVSPQSIAPASLEHGEEREGGREPPSVAAQAAGYRSFVPFFWRVACVNALVFALGVLLLMLTPATVSSPVVLSEALVLAGGVCILLVVNLLMLRSVLGPLEGLVSMMRRIDLGRPGQRLDAHGPAELATVATTFNAMLDRLERERRESGRRALLAQEGERKRIAQELHDEIGQSLTAVLMALARAAERVPPDVREELLGAREAARASLEDVRRVAQRLRPETLDDLGLASAAATLCRRFAESTAVAVERRIDANLPRLPPEHELVLYRVAQESLTNVARHAGATRVTVGLGHGPAGAWLSVADDGRGMDGAVAGGGIHGMRERALLVGAELSIARSAAGGVEVRLRVPEQPEA